MNCLRMLGSSRPFKSPSCFSSSEITTILNYRDAGNGLLIMADHQSDTQNYQVDANQIATPLGVTFYGFTDHGPHSGPITPDFADHPLFADVETIVGSNSEGNMYVNNPSEIIATFHGDNMITILRVVRRPMPSGREGSLPNHRFIFYPYG